jgi:hypothetical protein
MLCAQTADDHSAVIAELGRQADIFERSAYRVSAVETLRQTIPAGARTRTGPRGIEVRLPETTHEIVSEYGFLAEDVRGGSLREARMVLTVDGLKWKRGTKGFESLSKEMAIRDDAGRRRLLESWETFGLSGFITDLGQLILLFARGNASGYDIRFVAKEETFGEELWVYTYQQRGGSQALTIHGEGDAPLRQSLRGKIWVRGHDRLPVRVSLDSERKDSKGVLRDTAAVSYFLSPYGTLMPVRIVHEQYGDDTLLVKNEFTYSSFKQLLPRPGKR